MAPIRDWTGAITFFPHIPPQNKKECQIGSVENLWG